MRVSHTPRFLQALVTPCFSEVMAAQLPAEATLMGSARFQLWRRVWPTHRFLQALVTPYFSEVMAAQLLAETILFCSARFQLWTKVWPTPRFLQDMSIQCFSGVMAVQWLAEEHLHLRCGMLDLWIRDTRSGSFKQILCHGLFLQVYFCCVSGVSPMRHDHHHCCGTFPEFEGARTNELGILVYQYIPFIFSRARNVWLEFIQRLAVWLCTTFAASGQWARPTPDSWAVAAKHMLVGDYSQIGLS